MSFRRVRSQFVSLCVWGSLQCAMRECDVCTSSGSDKVAGATRSEYISRTLGQLCVNRFSGATEDDISLRHACRINEHVSAFFRFRRDKRPGGLKEQNKHTHKNVVRIPNRPFVSVEWDNLSDVVYLAKTTPVPSKPVNRIQQYSAIILFGEDGVYSICQNIYKHTYTYYI